MGREREKRYRKDFLKNNKILNFIARKKPRGWGEIFFGKLVGVSAPNKCTGFHYDILTHKTGTNTISPLAETMKEQICPFSKIICTKRIKPITAIQIPHVFSNKWHFSHIYSICHTDLGDSYFSHMIGDTSVIYMRTCVYYQK